MPFIYREKEGVGYYEVSAWERAAGVFTTRLGGLSDAPFDSLNLGNGGGDDSGIVAANRDRLAVALGIAPGVIRTVRQVHGSDVFVLSDEGAPKPALGYDAIVTDINGAAISVLTADCVPILMYDPKNRVVAAVHAGWEGTVKGVTSRAVRAMAQEYGSDPSEILAAVGPSIGPCCYEVDERVVAPFKENITEGGSILYPSRPGHWKLDLWEANARLLVSAGVKKDNIDLMGLCTSCNTDRFFSHRKSGGRTGRMMAIARLTGGR